MKSHNLTSNKPYLLRAICEWIADNNMTPYIVADVTGKNTKVPLQYAQDNQITLDISSTAVVNLQISNKYITFSATFGGTQMQIVIPVGAVLAIFPQETGPAEGMIFPLEECTDEEYKPDNHNNNFPGEQNTTMLKNSGKTTFHNPNLKIIK